jgi:hypothetical protein
MSRRDTTEKVDIEIVDTKPEGDHIERKPQVIEIGAFRVVGISPEDAEFYQSYPEDKRKKVFRKVSKAFLLSLIRGQATDSYRLG